jgi:glycosyltransferase involved in cell wall biosynthesis
LEIRVSDPVVPESKVNPSSLVVFADDWGRHPSSCQHLIRQLLGRYRVFWVNTIGMRPPRLDLATLRRGAAKIRQWLSNAPNAERHSARPEVGPHVLNPRMWPWLTAPVDRRINRSLLLRQLVPLLRSLDAPPVALTTIPIVADLVGALPVCRWVYYCVDDFGVWPGLDAQPLQRMEIELVRKVDQVIAVSETLREKLRQMGREAHLLTHGVDLEFWRDSSAAVPSLAGVERPLIVFWGVLDRRMDFEFLRRLANDLRGGTIVFAGPEDNPDPRLASLARTVRLGSLPFGQLPSLGCQASVLVMPYADLPVTQMMQPLKLKEYLATGCPVVVRDLPATREWADCADVASTPEAFSEAVRIRLHTGLPDTQRAARQRLLSEGWPEKARLLERWALEPSPPKERHAGGAGRKTRTAAEPVVLHTRVVVGAGGGPEKTIFNSPRFLIGRYRLLCAYMHAPADPGFEHLSSKAEEAAAPLLSVHDSGPLDFSVFTQFLAICRREKVAIWHGHDYKSNALGLLLRLFHPMRLVTTVHGWVQKTRRTPFYYFVDRLCLPNYEIVVCVSEDLYKQCLAYGVRKQRCFLIENAIDTAEYSRKLSLADAKQRLGIPPARFVIGGVGRLSAEKGFDLLIRAVDQILKTGADVQLLIAGEGNDKVHLESLIAQLGRQDRIRLLGYRMDTMALFQAMDAFALSSIREGLPNVVLEAMALEVPVAATRVAGMLRLIQSGENGLLIEPGSVEQLVGALARLLGDSALRQRLAAAARQTIEKKHSFCARMEKVAGLYDSLLKRS